MKVVGLLSGGKDSCFNLCHCVAQGHQIVALATLTPPKGKDECDSYMYQTVGHDAVHLVAQAMGLPLYRQTITGKALNQSSIYGRRKPSTSQISNQASAENIPQEEDHDETDDLLSLLLQVKSHHPEIDALSAGAILSNYQRIRVEHVASHPNLRLTPLTYLWQHSQRQLLIDMEKAGLEAILIKVAGIGLEERDLGKSLRSMRPKLEKLNNMYGAHVAGEGGEYETLTLDSPLFTKRIEIIESEVVIHSEASFASVSYLRIKEAKLVEKMSLESESSLLQMNLNQESSKSALARPAELDFISRITEKEAKKALLKVSQQSEISSTITKSHSTKIVPSISSSGKWVAVGNIIPKSSGQSSGQSSEPSLETDVNSAFDSLEELLSRYKLSTPHITHINLYLSDQSLFSKINAIYSQRFESAPPSRACVGISRSDSSDPLLRMDVLAFDDGTRYSNESSTAEDNTSNALDSSRKVLHVQGRSYWAPANIGPYSQAVTAASRISIAGQIGLIPSSLDLPPLTSMQVALSLQHARRIFAAVLEGEGVKKGRDESPSLASSHQSKGWIEGMICWLDEEGLESDSTLSTDQDRSFASLLSMAQAAWSIQSSPESFEDSEEGGEEEMGELEKEWHSSWLGQESKSTSDQNQAIPALFVAVPEGALPRGARVEWQLTAHTGQALVRDVDAEEDEDEKSVAVPEGSSGSISLASPSIVGKWSWRGSAVGRSAFGILSFTFESDSISDSTFEDLKAQLSRALSIRVFYSTRRGVDPSKVLNVLENLPLRDESASSPSPAITLVPVQTLFSPMLGNGEKGACDVAVVWTSVD